MKQTLFKQCFVVQMDKKMLFGFFKLNIVDFTFSELHLIK